MSRTKKIGNNNDIYIQLKSPDRPFENYVRIRVYTKTGGHVENGNLLSIESAARGLWVPCSVLRTTLLQHLFKLRGDEQIVEADSEDP